LKTLSDDLGIPVEIKPLERGAPIPAKVLPLNLPVGSILKAL
jgi:hypothetical protein